MNVYRCRICAEPMLGAARPTHCPFCGAHQQHLMPADAYEHAGTGGLSKKSRDNLQQVLQLTTDNSNFYRGAAKVADAAEGRAVFEALARRSAQHARVAGAILEEPVPEESFEIGECSPAHKENLAELKKRVERALRRYQRYLEEAEEDRVQEVLEEFIAIEKDHAGLTE